MSKSTPTPKPITPVANALKRLWCVWLGYRLLCYPLLVAMVGGVGFVWGVLWQIVAMLPALAFTPALLRGRSPYALLWLSMVMLVYLGAVGVFAFMRFYESAPWLIWFGLCAETVLVLIINVLLFVLLKRLPPMHKTLQA